MLAGYIAINNSLFIAISLTLSNNITIKFFNKKLSLFNNDFYKTFTTKNKILFKDNFLNLEVIKEKRYESSYRKRNTKEI